MKGNLASLRTFTTVVYIFIYITVSGSLKPTKVPRRQEDQ